MNLSLCHSLRLEKKIEILKIDQTPEQQFIQSKSKESSMKIFTIVACTTKLEYRFINFHSHLPRIYTKSAHAIYEGRKKTKMQIERTKIYIIYFINLLSMSGAPLRILVE